MAGPENEILRGSVAGAVTRFAPSPTGLLHLGHAYSALFAHAMSREAGGMFIIRIEDIDVTRCRPEFEASIIEDMEWLGLLSDVDIVRQSERLPLYASALDRLRERSLLYPCFCTRKQIEAEIAAAGGAPHAAEGPVYPGTCRGLPANERAMKLEAGTACAWRLDVARAMAEVGELSWMDRERGKFQLCLEHWGDVVLARKDIATSYHLAVTVDDAGQGVTLVTRGEDLLGATHIHRLLQALLDLPVPSWQHHRLLLDPDGRRYAKRDRSLTLRSLRESGRSAEELRAELGF